MENTTEIIELMFSIFNNIPTLSELTQITRWICLCGMLNVDFILETPSRSALEKNDYGFPQQTIKNRK